MAGIHGHGVRVRIESRGPGLVTRGHRRFGDIELFLSVMNAVLVVTLVRLGFSGTALKPLRIFMYLSLQQLSTMYLLF